MPVLPGTLDDNPNKWETILVGATPRSVRAEASHGLRRMSNLPQLISKLESLWLAYAPNRDPRGLAPGLAASTVRATLESAGLPTPEEIVEWFSWQNGLIPGPRSYALLPPSPIDPLSLTQAVERREVGVSWAREVCTVPTLGMIDDEGIVHPIPEPDRHASQPEDHWGPFWIPLDTECRLVVDLGADMSAVPVHSIDWSDPSYGRPVRASSLADVITVWIDVLQGWPLEAFGTVDETTVELPMDVRHRGCLG